MTVNRQLWTEVKHVKQNVDIPCARSEPHDLEDEVISALLWQAGELLDCRERTPCRSQRTPCRSEFQTALDNLLTVVGQDGDLSRLLETLPLVLGSGVLLQPLFAHLFPQPPHPIAVSYSGNGSPRLGQREVEVLHEMAKGRSQKEIARRLFIAPNTVKTHIRNLYAKLEVDNPQEAVTKATALGLLPFDFAKLVHPEGIAIDVDFNAFANACLTGAGCGQQGEAEPMRQFAALGLLFFLLSPLTALVRYERAAADSLQRKGFLFEFTSDGHLVRSLDGEGRLKSPSALAFAPPAAERHGFRAGNLFLFDYWTNPDPLNMSSLLELTPDGRCVRAFTGGAHLSTRLTYGGYTAFTPDGRLLVTSGGLTDAVLEFTEGGGVVRRFADLVPYGGLTVDRRGNVYVAGGWATKSPVHVFNPQGDLLRTVGAGDCHVYRGVAVDDRGNLFVANTPDHCIEVFDASGQRLGSMKGGDLYRPCDLALSPGGSLYVIDSDRQVVKVFNPSRGNFLFSFPAPQGAQLTNLTFGPNGNLFVAGFISNP